MSPDDFNKAVVMFGLQLVAAFAGCLGAMMFWRYALNSVVLVN